MSLQENLKAESYLHSLLPSAYRKEFDSKLKCRSVFKEIETWKLDTADVSEINVCGDLSEGISQRFLGSRYNK